MDASEAVSRAIPVFVANAAVPLESLYPLLAQAGLSEKVVAEVVEFVPLAFGRFALAGTGVRLSEEYRRIDASGRERLRRRLTDEPIFQAAATAAPDVLSQGETAFVALASRSPEFMGVNQMLHKGSRPEDLILAEPTMYWFEGMPETARIQRPWWRFWA